MKKELKQVKKKPPDGEPHCGSCYFWWPTDVKKQADPMGECHNNPPVLLNRLPGDDPSANVCFGFWPETPSYEWCGKWKQG